MAALLLKREGHEVSGFHMKLFDGGEGAAEAARSACRALGIEFTLADLREEFEKKVKKYFAGEYAAGRTPNPCVQCNLNIKFGALLRRAGEAGADGLATGHYARKHPVNDKWQLLRGNDRRRDQSYFLYTLNQETLARVFFPDGEYEKEEIKRIAAEAGLPAAGRAESREICFVPDTGYAEVVEEILPGAAKPGRIVDRAGRQLGKHDGIINYTVGQRRGMGVSAPEPLYVIELRAAENEVVAGSNEELFAGGLVFGEENFVSGSPPADGADVEVKIRYNAPPVPAKFLGRAEGGSGVIFAEPQRAVTPGQAAVLYAGEVTLGGGTIIKALNG